MKINTLKSVVWQNRTPTYITTRNDQKKKLSLLSFVRPSLFVIAASRDSMNSARHWHYKTHMEQAANGLQLACITRQTRDPVTFFRDVRCIERATCEAAHCTKQFCKLFDNTTFWKLTKDTAKSN